ncbi:carboxypeptidase-like regulatory domain-containing protein [Bacteroidota bacterium]|nr:carboxypeptidase-like regulatory domain-containing protein [Bacteroidota bacterium]|tara:strand:- start:660 stop:3476 length:2817 start_codon:yes stop_codon:yes gene_type:complete
MKKHLLNFIFILFTSFIYSQSGKVTGLIMDGEYDEPMAFANVIVKGSTIGTTTDFDGKYSLDLEPGEYTLTFSFVGYQTIEVSEVLIKSDEVEQVDVTLSTNTLDEIIITTTVRKNTESAVLDIQKKSAVMLDGLSSQGIKKAGASNIASAVKSVPGVSVQGGKYVYVRGLGDRYTKSILNGVDIPGLDPDRNTIQMDIFPTNILENIIVIKSAAAEYPADFTGGVVDIVTRDFPTKKETSFSIGSAYNSEMHFKNDFLIGPSEGTDFLGFDNNSRSRPINRYQYIPGTFENYPLLTQLTSSFNPILQAERKTSKNNFNFGFTTGNQFLVGDNDKLGYQFSLSYRNETSFYKNRVDNRLTKDPNNSSNYNLLTSRLSTGDEGENNIILSGLAGLVYKRENSKYKLNLLHIQNGESVGGYFNQEASQAGAGGGIEQYTKDVIQYTQRSVTNLLLNGQHNIENGWNVDWKISPTLATVLDKDHRTTAFQITQEGDAIIAPSSSGYPQRVWRDLFEFNLANQVNFLKKYTLKDKPAKLKFGGGMTYKFRDFELDYYIFTSTNPVVPNGQANNLLLTENIWTAETQAGTHLVFGNLYQSANSYEGEQRIYSGYFSNEFELIENLKSVVGIRTELFQSYYTGQNQSGSQVFYNEKIIDNFDIYPSANLILSLNENSNLRSSFSKTTARPSFKEASRAQIYDAISDRLFIGNLDLKPSYIDNLDMRYEIFGDKGDIIAFSGFYKTFKDPIELTFFASAPNQLTARNLGAAKVYGAEFEIRKPLNIISDDVRKWRFSLNASLIKSSLEMFEDEYNNRLNAARDGESISRTRDLQGQSPFLINSNIEFLNEETGFQYGLFYNVQGRTLEVVGTGIVPDVYTVPFHSLNFNLKKFLDNDGKSSISIKAKNILNSKKESVYESFNISDEIWTSRMQGTEISIGYSLKF